MEIQPYGNVPVSGGCQRQGESNRVQKSRLGRCGGDCVDACWKVYLCVVFARGSAGPEKGEKTILEDNSDADEQDEQLSARL